MWGAPGAAFDQIWNDTVLKSSDGFFYDNVRCAPLFDNGPNQCQMILPAKRINVLPDGVDLVLVDDDKDYASPSFVAWLILGDAGPDPTNVTVPLLQRMCDPPQQATHVNGLPSDTFWPGRRGFVHTTTDNKSFSATSCTPIPNSNPTRYTCQVVVQ